MVTEFEITHKLINKEWEPYKGSVVVRGYANVDHGGMDIGFDLFINDEKVCILCDSRTQESEPETKDGFVNMIYQGKCWRESNILNQSKAHVRFGDYPNGNAKLIVGSEDNDLLEVALYYLKIKNRY